MARSTLVWWMTQVGFATPLTLQSVISPECPWSATLVCKEAPHRIWRHMAAWLSHTVVMLGSCLWAANLHVYAMDGSGYPTKFMESMCCHGHCLLQQQQLLMLAMQLSKCMAVSAWSAGRNTRWLGPCGAIRLPNRKLQGEDTIYVLSLLVVPSNDDVYTTLPSWRDYLGLTMLVKPHDLTFTCWI